MAYSDFKILSKFKKEFDLHIQEQVDLFAQIESFKPSDFLTQTLAETVCNLFKFNCVARISNG
ncbi:MAG: hypothetical protein F6K22_35905 [Okeania sp. SIO2F4]|nr:hypothetical protein [Okeania sp. SIO2F4]